MVATPAAPTNPLHSSGATARFSLVAETPAAPPAVALAYFRGKLAVETDASDVYTDLQNGLDDFVIVDTRSPEAYAEGHLPGAISLPHRQMNEETTRRFDKQRLIVTYCWGPGCNAGSKGAARLAALGFQVKEMIGGIEYWQREGYPVEHS